MAIHIITLAEDKTPICRCVTKHRPPYAYVQKHHIQPVSWSGPNKPSNEVWIEGTTHDATHDLLNKCVRFNGWPPADVVKPYTKYVQTLAKIAIDAVGGTPPRIFTAAAPDL